MIVSISEIQHRQSGWLGSMSGCSVNAWRFWQSYPAILLRLYCEAVFGRKDFWAPLTNKRSPSCPPLPFFQGRSQPKFLIITRSASVSFVSKRKDIASPDSFQTQPANPRCQHHLQVIYAFFLVHTDVYLALQADFVFLIFSFHTLSVAVLCLK